MSWTCATCSRTFAREGQSHSHDTVRLDEHFARRSAAVRQWFDLLVNALPSDVRVEPLRSVVILSARKTFAFVTVRARGLRIGVFLDAPIESPRVVKVDRRSESLVASEVVVRAPADVDDELCSWLRCAYRLGNSEQRTAAG